MKKLTTIFVVALFMFSIVPLAFAEDVAVTTDNTDVNVNTETGAVAVTTSAGVETDNEGNVEVKTKEVRVRTPREPREGPIGNLTKEQREERLKEMKERIELRKENISERMGKISERLESSRLRMAEHLAEKNPNFMTFVETLSDADKEKFFYLSRSQQEQVMKEGASSLENYNITKVNKAEAFQKRQVREDKLVKAEENFKKAEEKYGNVTKRYTEAKEKFEKAVKAGNETEAKKLSKEFLTNAADMVISSLEKVKEKAQASNDLTEEEVTQIVTDINAKIAEMETAKQALSEADSKEKIKAIGKDILASWEKTKLAIRGHAEKVIEGKVGEIIERSESLERKLEKVLANMEAKNISVDGLDTKVSEISTKIETARTLFSEGRATLEAAMSQRSENMTAEQKAGIKADIDAAQAKIRKAHETMKEVQKAVAELAKEIKAKGGSLETKEDSEEVVVTETAPVTVETSEGTVTVTENGVHVVAEGVEITSDSASNDVDTTTEETTQSVSA